MLSGAFLFTLLLWLLYTSDVFGICLWGHNSSHILLSQSLFTNLILGALSIFCVLRLLKGIRAQHPSPVDISIGIDYRRVTTFLVILTLAVTALNLMGQFNVYMNVKHYFSEAESKPIWLTKLNYVLFLLFLCFELLRTYSGARRCRRALLMCYVIGVLFLMFLFDRQEFRTMI